MIIALDNKQNILKRWAIHEFCCWIIDKIKWYLWSLEWNSSKIPATGSDRGFPKLYTYTEISCCNGTSLVQPMIVLKLWLKQVNFFCWTQTWILKGLNISVLDQRFEIWGQGLKSIRGLPSWFFNQSDCLGPKSKPIPQRRHQAGRVKLELPM